METTTSVSQEIAQLEVQRIKLEKDLAELDRRIAFYRELELALAKQNLEKVLG